MSSGTKESNSLTCMKIFHSFPVGFFDKELTFLEMNMIGSGIFIAMSGGWHGRVSDTSRNNKSPLAVIYMEYKRRERRKI